MINLIDKKLWKVFYAIIFASFFLSMFISTIPYYYQIIEAEEKIDITKQQEMKDKCIKYNESKNLISITCKNITFADISSNSQLQDSGIIIQQKQKQQSSPSITRNNNEEKIWLLNAGIKIEKETSLDIKSKDVTWLKIISSKNIPNAITVDGSLKVDSIKITSWNLETNDYIKFPKDAKYNEALYAKVSRPYIKINTDATAPTIIQNSELAYLGYSCSGCGGVTFNGGENSILKNNDIHHIYKGFYSKDMGHMLIEGNHVYENEKYGIDPHSGTHDIVIKNNTVYNNYAAGIICSADCYNVVIEENKVYNNGHGNFERGVAVSKNVYDSIIRKNIVYDEDICISIGRDSHHNKIYDNILSNCLNGVNVTMNSFNNEIYNNKIEKVDYGLVVDDKSNNNVFHFNIVTDVKIGVKFEDKTTKGNVFANNTKFIH